MHHKDFINWHNLKVKIDAREQYPSFRNKEIWWFNAGINIGHEVDGKGERFTRPVLIIRKFNRRLFWGIPLTTKIKTNPFYLHFRLNGKDQCAMLTQMRLWEASRLINKIGKISDPVFEKAQKALIEIIKN